MCARSGPEDRDETIRYDDAIVRHFSYATIIWGLIGLLAGLWLALELSDPRFNIHEVVAFGRLRPLHTNAVIFAFVGNGLFAGIYYSTQRLLKTRLASDLLSKVHFWGWQAIIVSAVITLPLGFTSSKEYAELFRAQGRAAACLQLPPVDHPLLGAGVPLHLGGPAPPAQLGAPGLGSSPSACSTGCSRACGRPTCTARSSRPRTFGLA